MTQTQYCGRFAPSPTGPLHFGSLVVAVASYLDARAHNGTWLIRMEDLDTPRIELGAAEDILRTLAACGMRWDGMVVYQSTRRAAYHSALHRLRDEKLVYACVCSRREIADSAVYGIDGPAYPGTCRHGPPTKTARTLRLDTRQANISFVDLIQGEIHQNLEVEVGDFPLYRAGGMYAYQLAVVIDDAEQRVSDVVRGADLLDSTPRQIYLQHLLRLRTPRYLHVPVVTDSSGQKLSKQTRAPRVDAQRPLPALMTALTFLNHRPPSERPLRSVDELWKWALHEWRIDRVPKLRSRMLPPMTF
jgi:glutamyl-Q tRNA(Asp) synthetase